MVSNKKDNVLAVLSISGGNDGLNTMVPYADGLYRDYRPTLGISEEQVIKLDDHIGMHPAMSSLKRFWDEGKLAIFLGIGYPNPSYSHFRSMDIWHTCEPDKVGIEGWLGKVIKEVDPNAENVLTGVNFGRGLPRALAKEGVPVASVGNLETYGLLTGIDGDDQRNDALDVFGRMYGPTIGSSYTLDYIRRTGTDALKGADILATAPSLYLLRRGVLGHLRGPVHEEHRPDLPGWLRHPGVVHHFAVQRLRHPRQPGFRPRPAVD